MSVTRSIKPFEWGRPWLRRTRGGYGYWMVAAASTDKTGSCTLKRPFGGPQHVLQYLGPLYPSHGHPLDFGEATTG
jgi:hypothetical protein